MPGVAPGGTTRMRAAWRCAVLLAALVAVCTIGNTTPRATTSSSAQPAATRHTALSDSGPHPIVALGDSVPSGAACGCTPYPPLSGSALTPVGVRHVSVDNLAVGAG